MIHPRAIWSSISPMERNLSSLRQNDLSGFDGNRNDIVAHWLFPKSEVFDDEEGVLSALMEITLGGNLRWALFPVVLPR